MTVVAQISERNLDKWSAEEADRLDQRAGRQRSSAPFQSLYALRASVLRGEGKLAIGRLKQLCNEHADLYSSDISFYVHALATFAWALDMRPMAKWASVHVFDGQPVTIDVVDAPSTGDNVIGVTFSNKRQISFEFPKGACRNSRIKYIIGKWLYMLPLFRCYLASSHFRAGGLSLNLGDGAQVPGLAQCGSKANCYLIPDGMFMKDRGYQHIKDHFAANAVPWSQRIPIVFWRGGPTGHRRGTPWHEIPRARLCAIANTAEAQGLIDAGISKTRKFSAEQAAEMKEHGLIRDYVPSTEFNRYRYTIDIDGNTNSFSGLFVKLCTGSVVLKVGSPRGHRQWYYDDLRPWINFVPVETDMSDLIEKAKWLRDHDDLAAAIAARGQEFAFSMSFEREVERASMTIADCVGRLNGGADREFTFGEQGTARPFVSRGFWHHEAERSWCDSVFGELTLPRLTSLADWELSLQMDAHLPSISGPGAAVQCQRLTIYANGNHVGDFEIKEAANATVTCNISAVIAGRSDQLNLMFVHPDGEPPAKYVAGGSLGPRSIAFRRLTLARRL